MFRRLVLLLAAAGIGWIIYTRTRQGAAVTIGDQADLRPDEERGGITERVSQAAADAAATARRLAQAPVERARALVGGAEDQTAEGERLVTPDGPPAEGEPVDRAGGYAPADPGREPSSTPDAYRPAAEASSRQAGRREALSSNRRSGVRPHERGSDVRHG